MKRLLLLPLLAIALHAQPVPTVNVTGTARVGAIWPHDLTFEWHCESTTAEYSVGDATATGSAVITNTVAYDGAYSLYAAAAGACYGFDITGNDLVNGDAGTFDFWAYVTEFGNGASFVYAVGGTSNAVYVTMYTDQKVRLYHKASGVSSTVISTNSFNTNEWFHVVAKWQRGTSPYLQIDLNGSPTQYTDGDLSVCNADFTQLRVGETVSIASKSYEDNVRAYSVWK